MDLIGISPLEWGQLHRWDKLALHYYSLRRLLYEEERLDNVQSAPKLPKDLPQQDLSRIRRRK